MKKLNDGKIIGYALLIAGVCIMGYSIASVIGVFTGGEVPVKILQSENKKTNPSSQPNQQPDLGDVMTPLFPMFNALTWLAIAFFIIAAGGRVARIGINMMKVSISDEVKIIKSVEDKKIETGKTK
ncbi:MAG: hypothetical protein NTV74_00445 [Euryarchaeota archaeon]|nr:hypothetical protein [Euryarchaeota archaeon]